MVYSKKVMNLVRDARISLQMVNQNRDNKENVEILKSAQAKVLSAIGELEE